MELISKKHLKARILGEHPGCIYRNEVADVIEDEEVINPLADLCKWIDEANPQSVGTVVMKIKDMEKEERYSW